MKIRKVIFGGGAILLVLLVFTLDVVRKSVAIDVSGPLFLRDLLLLGAFALLYYFFDLFRLGRSQTPIKTLGFVFIATLMMTIIAIGMETSVANGFDAKDDILIPLDYGTLFVASLLGLTFGIFALLLVRSLRDLVLYKRKRSTKRNFLAFIVLTLAASASALWLNALEKSVLTSTLFGLAVVAAVVNSFRQSWIVYLTKREKVFSLIYTFFLFFCFLALNVIIHREGTVTRSLQYYSLPLLQVVSLACLFGNTYFGMAFVSTLFHLPTAEAFDRKTSEVSSLHNLSRLVTQVFDFNELVETVTTMTLQVVEAKSAWLEIIHPRGEHSAGAGGETKDGYVVQIAALQNITRDEIEHALPLGERTLRDTVIGDMKLILVEDVHRDTRFGHLKKSGPPMKSLVVAPLVSHNGIIGILYATKAMEYGFFKDDVDVIAAFADQATIAIENSRLIKKSIEREHLMREMALAQEMQRKLLPQSLPRSERLEIDAVSTPAFEVGGDYYDVIQFDQRTIGIVVGDVSGKGVSAAFYMSEVKGIFQAISRMYPSPREFMIRANEALSPSIDKHSFVSLIYAVIDTASGQLTLSRAGHCPMLHISQDTVSYLRPGGMGMGLSEGEMFAGAIEEVSLTLREGDVCVFYTDGVTEARCLEDEFGYDRLVHVARASREKNASEIKQDILEAINTYLGGEANHDDLTLVVVKWRGIPAIRESLQLEEL
jgi:sigma-B regulation protein RsbU (phosphoserine phosphatase)